MGHENPARVDGPDSVNKWLRKEIKLSAIRYFAPIVAIYQTFLLTAGVPLTESGGKEQTNSRDTDGR